MDQLPPHRQRARQPVEPRSQRHRHHPLRHPQHCGSFLPLISTVRTDFQNGALRGAVFVYSRLERRAEP
nr:hypothetical protein [Ensifer sp. SSB1]